MKDYSNFNPNPINKLIWSSQKVFNNQLKFEGQEIKIENKLIKAIIRNHGNPTNEFKEERFLITGKEIDIQRGDIIEYLNEIYLVITDVDRDNQIYNTCKLKKCNNVLTFQYEKDIHKIPCVLSNATLYSDGLEEKQMILSNDQRNVLIPYNKLTNKIQLQQRFVFNHNSVFSVSLIDDFTFKQIGSNNGLLQLNMVREQKQTNLDDFENNLADNSHLKKEEPIILQIDNKTIQLEINKTYQLNPKLFQGGKEVNSQEQLNKISYIVDDDSIIKVENGLIISLQKGDTNIQVCYGEYVISVPIQITDTSVHSGTCNIVGDTFMKIGKLSKWIVELYDSQGNKIDGNVEWDIVGDNVDELIKIREKTSNSIVLLAHKKQENIGKKFIIKCKTLDGLSFDQQEIILKSLI
ncbi:TPA: hypothetical protein ACXDAY_002074 [Clostridium botulinum]|uniref:hypothetical protein n=2 Tax=Clostridium botulinum TaxID=1491 RepID=UPI000463B25B|nr:hypothetical protein [Clostridium botulinum]APR02322.1 hypothetical protein RSJ2_4115 [Clostridium botulinum]AUN01622.1 hypothetical protein RSJ19_01195 [Clostridium botulinum]MBN3359343.1 hypothetical protein [Clostridium botulinum]MBN3367172.1 hypothetical protein [Clostridium botulinum]MBN3371805.1 hypothetical protein [Clostridium botulinum]